MENNPNMLKETQINNHPIKVLFVASDNNTSSGAFISLVTLADILINKYSLDAYVILPHWGNGIELLNEKKIPYKKIYSFSWVIPISAKDSNFNKIKIIAKKIFNILAKYQILLSHQHF